MINQHSEDRHGYTPVTVGKSALILVPLALVGLGLFALQKTTQVEHAVIAALVAFAVAILILLALF